MYAMQEWMQRVKPVRGLFSYEVGGKHRHGHLQGVLRIRWPGDQNHADLL